MHLKNFIMGRHLSLFVSGALVLSLTFSLIAGPVLAAGESVSVWMTMPDQSQLLQQQASLTFAPDSGSNPLTVTVNPSVTYQQMDGWGASFTDSSAYLVFNSSARNAIMNDLFNTSSGIGLSFLRQPMGASDFSRSGNYNFDNTCCDLSDFSISHDTAYIIPLLQQARSLNSSVKVIITPWSPPGWMKTSGSMIGGGLNSGTYSDALAQYFVKTIQGYQGQGVPIYGLTVQNEPLYSPSGYPGSLMPAADQAGFVGYNLGPALAAAGLGSVKIMAYDHNWDQPGYPTTVFANSTASQYVAGVAWHCYGGDVSAELSVHNSYPNKDAWLTECSGGNWAPYYNNFDANLKGETENLIILNARDWGKGAILWNMALDPNNGPTNGGCTTCRGVVTVNGGSYTKTVDYYVLGQASKFVRPGAYRIDSNTFGASSIEDVAFKNPDGSLVVLALNNASFAQTFKILVGGQSVSYSLPAGAVATFKWTPGTGATATPTRTNTPAGPTPTRTNTPTCPTPTRTPTPTGAGISTTAWYSVVNKTSGKCADMAGAATTDGTKVQDWTCNNTYAQQWQFQTISGSNYRVNNRNNSAEAWDVTNVSTADGALIQTWTYGGGNNQQWQAVSEGGGFYHFVNLNSGKCLDLTNGSTADGVQFQQWACSGGPNQSFSLLQQP